MDALINIWQEIKYGVLRREGFDFDQLPKTLNFNSNYDPNKDLHWLECVNLPEFYVTGRNKEELARNVTDTLMVYYDVPTYFAKRYKPNDTRFTFENKKTGEHEYVSLDYIEELRKAAA